MSASYQFEDNFHNALMDLPLRAGHEVGQRGKSLKNLFFAEDQNEYQFCLFVTGMWLDNVQ